MSIGEIVVFSRDEEPREQAAAHQARLLLGIEGVEVAVSDIYRVEGATQEDLQILADAIVDPVTHDYEIVDPTHGKLHGHSSLVEIAPKPGTTHPVNGSLQRAAELAGVTVSAVSASTLYEFSYDIADTDRDRIVHGVLMNPIVQRIQTERPATLRLGGERGPIEKINIELDDASLDKLSKDRQLHLNLEEMRVIRDYYIANSKKPTDAELEIIAAAWSEHCGHKTFNARIEVDGRIEEALFKRIKDTSRKYFESAKVISAFHDNSGVIELFDGWAISAKVETHNSPSAIEPYGGSMTGSGGVFRDTIATGQGAEVILSTDMFCLADSKMDKLLLPKGCLPSDYLQQRVVDGVRDYGNRDGIPTANGSFHYHNDYRAKPTVIVGSYGLMPVERAPKGEPQVGDRVIAVGGRTGRDGIHGATFSSGTMTSETISVNSSAVQIGDPIQEQKLMNMILEARDADCIRALTDCGAAGFSSAVGEIGAGIGVKVDLALAPLKYEGLAPWEIFLSESQERLVLAVDPTKLQELREICLKHEVEMADLGLFTGNNILEVMYGDEVVASLDYEFLENGLPQRQMVANWTPEIVPERHLGSVDLEEALCAVLAHGNVCSKEPVVRQYDHKVQGRVVLEPFTGINRDGPNDAAVLRPIRGKNYGMVQAHGMNPILNRINPYQGSLWACAEAVANYVAVGGNPNERMALVNNYIWPTPTERMMGSLRESVNAVCDFMDAVQAPVVSGKDSLSSTFDGRDQDGEKVHIEVPPVLAISAFGAIEDVRKTVSSDLKSSLGTTLILVGNPDYEAMGGSTLYDVYDGSSNLVPRIDLDKLPQTLTSVHSAIQSGKVLACHDVSEGGVIAAVTEMAIGGDCGVRLEVEVSDGWTPTIEQQLFNETAGCFVLEVRNSEAAKELFGDNFVELGKTTHDRNIEVARSNEKERPFVSVPLAKARAAWKGTMEEFYAA